MRANLNELLEIIPDYDKFVSLTNEIGELLYQKLMLEKEIKSREAEIIKECSTNSAYFRDGKPPSMSFISSTYQYSGISGELLPLREKLAEVSSLLEKSKLKLIVLRDMLDVWRTLSANERMAST